MSFETSITRVNTFLHEVATYAQSQGIGTYVNTVGRNVYLNTLPGSPVACVAFATTGGVGEDSRQTYNLMAHCRAATYESALLKAEDVFSIFANKIFGPGGERQLILTAGRCVPTHRVGPWFKAPSGHPVFTLNFRFRIAGMV